MSTTIKQTKNTEKRKKNGPVPVILNKVCRACDAGLSESVSKNPIKYTNTNKTSVFLADFYDQYVGSHMFASIYFQPYVWNQYVCIQMFEAICLQPDVCRSIF